MSRFQRITASLVTFSVLTTGIWLPAHGASIDTQAVMEAGSPNMLQLSQAKTLIANTLQRADLQEALRAKGVSREAIDERISALTDAEVMQLAKDIENAPAGQGDIIGALVFVFVLLLVTDILGLTKVFPFTRSIRR